MYLVNPLSGTIKKGPFLFSVKSITESKGIEYEIEETAADGNYFLIKEKIVEGNFTDVVIIGGDGTVRQVIHALRDIDHLCFGIIPLGSGNGLARAAKIPSKPLQALSLLFSGTAKKIDSFTINNHFSCMLSGIGFDAKVAHDFAEKATRGLLTYTQQSLINYFKAHPYQFEVTTDDFSFFTEAYSISIANSNQFGNNVTIAPQASLTDGLLDIVIIQKMHKARLPFAVLKQIRGNNKLQKMVDDLSKNYVLYFQTPCIKIKNLKHAPFHIDGDPMPSSDTFEASIIKDCFQLIQP
ncbi:MAG: YegS/Rv2252/BmrU family lipid kinase [Bacteroidota bacterium]|nr:YegS/Rv2252/BmrU family lipid kinase [Bacteroidota bacterium]